MTVRVLVVEDKEDDYQLILLELQHAGISVESCRVWSLKGLQAALEETWDVILVDWHLPEFTAPEILSRLSRTSPPCIVVSGVAGDGPVVAAIQLGAANFVRKDNLDRLAGAIRLAVL